MDVDEFKTKIAFNLNGSEEMTNKCIIQFLYLCIIIVLILL